MGVDVITRHGAREGIHLWVVTRGFWLRACEVGAREVPHAIRFVALLKWLVFYKRV